MYDLGEIKVGVDFSFSWPTLSLLSNLKFEYGPYLST